MKDMTSRQIRERIAAIKTEQAAHEARDFDSELRAVMLAGGDVDKLENQQLEAERTARRLRVEAQALKATLPDVVRTEVRTKVEQLAEGGKADHIALNKHIDALIALDQKRLEIYAAIDVIHDRQDAAMEEARALTGAGKFGTHGEIRGEEKIISDALAQELLALLKKDARDLSQVPAPTARLLHEHLLSRGVERDQARHAAFMRQLAAEKAA